MERPHAGKINPVRLLLQGVDADDTLIQLFGAAEIRELLHKGAHLLRAGDDDVQHPEGVRTGGLHIVHVDADEGLLRLVSQLIDIVA